MNLNWIKELIALLPETSIGRKNLISIAGYPRWENVNSNLLAFYLDESEEHGFKRLFINSLLDVIQSRTSEDSFKREVFETDCSVEREVTSDNGGRIDILIVGKESLDEDENEGLDASSSWAIIIENKLFANIANNLNDYWKSITTQNKIGVILTVNPICITNNFQNQFINITHRELVDQIKSNLHEFYINADDRHLLFLKEYISNVNSLYTDQIYNKNMDRTLQLFQSKKSDIEEFKKIDLKLLRYVSRIVFDIMTKKGFPPTSTKDASKSKHFKLTPEIELASEFLKEHISTATKFRFWINLNKLRYNNVFEGCFELWGKTNTQQGEELKRRLEEKNIFTVIPPNNETTG